MLGEQRVAAGRRRQAREGHEVVGMVDVEADAVQPRTIGLMPSVAAARRCGKKLSSPKRSGTASGGETRTAFEPPSSCDGAIVNDGSGRCAASRMPSSAGLASGMSPGIVSMPFRASARDSRAAGGNGGGMAVAGAVVDKAGAIALGQRPRRRVEGHDDDAGEARGAGDRGEHVLEHRQRQPGAAAAAQPGEPLLGAVPFLDRNDRPDVRRRNARPQPNPVRANRSARGSSTARASASRSASVCIKRARHLTGRSSSAVWAASPHRNIAVDDAVVMRATVGASTGRPSSAIIFAVGPLTARPAMMGDTAMTGRGGGERLAQAGQAPGSDRC